MVFSLSSMEYPLYLIKFVIVLASCFSDRLEKLMVFISCLGGASQFLDYIIHILLPSTTLIF